MERVYGGREKAMDKELSRYQFHPNNDKELTLENITFKMRDLRLFYILVMAPVGVFILAFSAALLSVLIMGSDNRNLSESAIIVLIILAAWLCYFGAYKFYIFYVKKKDETASIRRNLKIYQIDFDGDLIAALRADLKQGVRFLKNHNLMISNRFVMGSVADPQFDPIVIPIDQIKYVEYDISQSFDLALRRYVYQRFYFHTINGREITVYVNDKYNPDLALKALQANEINTVEKKKG